MTAPLRTDPTQPRPRPSSVAILRASDVGTVVFAVTAIASAIFLEQLKAVVVVVSGVLFLLGCAAFLWAFAIAVQRSRTEAIGMGGLFFLMGSARRDVQLRLLGALAVQAGVGLATAALRPFTSQAFAVLAPMFGLGVTGLWSARYGRFGLRQVESADE